MYMKPTRPQTSAILSASARRFSASPDHAGPRSTTGTSEKASLRAVGSMAAPAGSRRWSSISRRIGAGRKGPPRMANPQRDRIAHSGPSGYVHGLFLQPVGEYVLDVPGIES